MLVGLSLIAVLWACSAGPTPEVAARERRTVILLAAESNGSIAAAMRGQLAGVGVELRVVSPGGLDVDTRRDTVAALGAQPTTLAVVWVTHVEGDVAVLYLYEAKTTESFWREVPGDGNAAASAEAVALGARRAVNGLLEGYPAGMQAISSPRRVEPVAAANTQAPIDAAKPPAARRHHVLVRAAYTGRHFAPQARWQSGAVVWAGWQAPRGLYVAAGYSILAPIRVRHPTVTLDLRRHPTEVVTGFHLQRLPLEFEVEAAVIVDVVTARSSTEPSFSAVSPTLVDFGGGVRARLGFVLLPWLSLPIGLGLDVYPLVSPYVARTPERTVLLDPRKARVRIDVGLAVRI